MTKGDLRRARKAARAAGQPLRGELAVPLPRSLSDTDRHGPAVEFRETRRGIRARERWARHYDALNGAPEGDWDR